MLFIFATASGFSLRAATLSQARYVLAATSVGNYALFAGGYDGDNPSNVVDIFDFSVVITGQLFD